MAIENGVTGRNYSKKQKKDAVTDMARSQAVEELPHHVESVVAGMLVLVSVAKRSAEGELAVGLARVLQSCDRGMCKVLWFVRKDWCKKPRKFEWGKAPTFRVAADPTNATKRYITKEPLEKILPIKIETTENCKKDHPRLGVHCVRMIKEFCMQRDLICPKPAEVDDTSDSSFDAQDIDEAHEARETGDKEAQNMHVEAQDLHTLSYARNQRVADRVRARKRTH